MHLARPSPSGSRAEGPQLMLDNLKRMAGAAEAEFPAVTARIDGSAETPDGVWWLDFLVDGKFCVSIEWCPKRGFGIHNQAGDDEPGYGVKPDEIYPDAAQTWARVKTLLAHSS